MPLNVEVDPVRLDGAVGKRLHEVIIAGGKIKLEAHRACVF